MTGLLAGLKKSEAIEVLQKKAIEQRGIRALGFWTERVTTGYLVAISRPESTFVVAIDHADYSGLKLAEVLGFLQGNPNHAAHARAKELKK